MPISVEELDHFRSQGTYYNRWPKSIESANNLMKVSIAELLNFLEADVDSAPFSVVKETRDENGGDRRLSQLK